MTPNHIHSDLTKYGFTPEQSQDLKILLSLKTPEEIGEWILAVGEDDVNYGISLIECLALTVLDVHVECMVEMPEAATVLSRFMK